MRRHHRMSDKKFLVEARKRERAERKAARRRTSSEFQRPASSTNPAAVKASK